MQTERFLYEVSQLPIFQNRVYEMESEAIDCPKGDIRLVENLETGLVYNAAFESKLMVYDNDYQNEQAFSPMFREHLVDVAEIIKVTIGPKSLVEVGCGKGTFLEMLLAADFDIVGFDPTYEGSNPRITRQYFDPSIGIEAKGLVLRHVLEHIQDPFSFLLSMRDANCGGGLVYIEVPCFDWICKHRAWFDVFYEHVNYFRLSDFEGMFTNILKSGHVFGGQYIYVVADLASLVPSKYRSDDQVDFPLDFVRAMNNYEAPYRTEKNKTAVWGGSSKGVIFTLLKSRLGQRVDAVIDINPAKQGKYLPGSGLLVESPQVAINALPSGSTMYVMNSNYLNEIKKMSGNKFNYMSIDNE